MLVVAKLFRVEVTLNVAEVPLSEISEVDTEIVRDEIEIQEGTVPQVCVAAAYFYNVNVSVAMQLLFDLYAATV